ncbi:MAG: ABC transporter permease [Defluviitaleaceae bacterium]|nr:ABC transporter permease [Defluviitaleaceae bacterium]
MHKIILRRILLLIPQLLIISFVAFFLGVMMPGDALSGKIDPSVSAEVRQHQRELLGLNRPIAARYFEWIGGMMRGDFGQSYAYRRPVAEIIGERASNTFWLSLLMLVLTYAIAVPLGVLAGRYKGSVVDRAVMFYVFAALSVPTLVLAILMIFVFAFQLGWFPSGGSVNAIVLASGNMREIFLNRLHHMILPATTGALLGTVGIIFMLRANIIEKSCADYVTLAKSKGVPDNVIFRRHVLRNSMIPVAAGFGFSISGLLAGTLFIEKIFHYPGMGQLFFSSVGARDFTVANTLIIIFSALSALGMLLSDILLTIVDPRIRQFS